MKVKELIRKLESLDQNIDIFCCNEGNKSISIFQIDHVDSVQATTDRSEDGKVTIKYGKSPTSSNCAIIAIKKSRGQVLNCELMRRMDQKNREYSQFGT